ncbi:MAG: hydrogenase expression/formation protein HypE [candidate division WOR-3 bacterium]|nr:MAG: hydrogenase expression/formation protein HypE [candidate division WOR-3 bacterium]
MSKTQPRYVVGDIWDERIVMGHGSGGRKMHRLIARVFLKHFGNPVLRRLEDGARIGVKGRRLVMSTDSYVVQPLFFPGGDIGKLAVCGTVNDIAVMGAAPEHLSVGFIVREGVELDLIEKLCRSIGRTAKQAGVKVVAGDTKVIEKGDDEGVYINTTGIGTVRTRVKLGPEQVKAGDAILLNGSIGDHEAAVAVARGVFRFRARLASDCAPLAGLIQKLVSGPGVKMMRDPTRGGLATTLNEIAEATGLGLVLHEELVPISPAVRGVAELLGLEPLYMANEGKVIVVASPEAEKRLTKEMHKHVYGRKACRVGEVVAEPKGVWLRTAIGSLRRLIMLEGQQLPRIC